MPLFSFLLHDEVGDLTVALSKRLASVRSAEAFGRRLLTDQSHHIAVEASGGGARVATIKKTSESQASATPAHEVIA